MAPRMANETLVEHIRALAQERVAPEPYGQVHKSLNAKRQELRQQVEEVEAQEDPNVFRVKPEELHERMKIAAANRHQMTEAEVKARREKLQQQARRLSGA